MHLASDTITYILLFLALYVEVFFLITYFEFKAISLTKIFAGQGKKKSEDEFPSVSMIVPVWNEETTILKTIFSILKLNYPKDKLSIFIVDDGSTDNTWRVLQVFAHNKQIKLLRKENGGKYTALNYALEFDDSEIMAVTPSIKIFEPKGILGLIQKAEYIFGIFLRKVFSNLNAVYITPGPFSIFRRSVFQKIGGYRHAHNTEDMEIGMR